LESRGSFQGACIPQRKRGNNSQRSYKGVLLSVHEVVRLWDRWFASFFWKKAGKMAGAYIRSIVGKEHSLMSMVVLYASAFLEETGVCKVEEYKLLDSQVLFKV